MSENQNRVQKYKKICTCQNILLILHDFFAEGVLLLRQNRKNNKRNNNMTKAELVNEIAISTGYDKKSINLIVDSMIKHVKKSLTGGENVYMRGFGSFILKTRKAKVARDIRSKVSVDVPEHSIPYFVPAKEFKEAVYDKTVRAKK